MVKTELFENADVTTVELAQTQVMSVSSSVHLSVSDEAGFQYGRCSK